MSDGSRLSWSIAVSATVSPCAAVIMSASLDAMGIMMLCAENHFSVWTILLDEVSGNQMWWHW